MKFWPKRIVINCKVVVNLMSNLGKYLQNQSWNVAQTFASRYTRETLDRNSQLFHILLHRLTFIECLKIIFEVRIAQLLKMDQKQTTNSTCGQEILDCGLRKYVAVTVYCLRKIKFLF